jgi:hypothetical protein
LAWKTAPVNSSDYVRMGRVQTSGGGTLEIMKSFFAFLFVQLLVIVGGVQIAAAQGPADDYSGMYSFLRDGEFLQITIEENGKVSGFISRFGDSQEDHGTFLDQFIKTGKSEGNSLRFTTESIHGVSFTFEGQFSRGPGKQPDQESYYLLRGKLTRITAGADSKANSQERTVEFKSFPRDAGPQ